MSAACLSGSLVSKENINSSLRGLPRVPRRLLRRTPTRLARSRRITVRMGSSSGGSKHSREEWLLTLDPNRSSGRVPNLAAMESDIGAVKAWKKRRTKAQSNVPARCDLEFKCELC
ncbi:unnamed protein product [Amoebophrya sp. A120]|nr:unnamed protein product [Amoebophrya sp. A120]|eukprot:GSA120T00004260001.1